MLIRDANESDLPAILEIYNDAILNTAAIWSDMPVDLANRQTWFARRNLRGYPVLVAVGVDCILGYASFGEFRPYEGYRLTVEHSVYVHSKHQRRGVATALMDTLIQRATVLGKHVMVGCIEAENQGSIQLHAGLGFRETGRMPQVGMKFGKWRDLVFMQLQLDSRKEPP